jgi:ectoine hydroxylase-related dioxygenase (phytanoyl-CoA dioxygenase family)
MIINNQFNRSGFVVIKNFIKKNESNLFEKKLFKIYGNILKIKINKKNIHSIISQHEKNKNYEFINSGVAIGIKKSKRTAYNWHQEKPYYKKINTLHFQFPILNPVNIKNGTMSVLKGSNKLGFLKEVSNIKLSKKSINSFVPKKINIFKKIYPEKYINLNLGDICIFDENLIHKTNKNITNKIRFAGIIRLRKI